MTDDNQEPMDQEDLEFLRKLREIPEKIPLPSDFHSRVMQTIDRREAITSEFEQPSPREPPLRFSARETPLPKARKWRNWWKVAALAQAAVIVLAVSGVFYYMRAAQQSSNGSMQIVGIGTGWPPRGLQSRAEKCAIAENAARLEARSQLAQTIVALTTEKAVAHTANVDESAASSYVRKSLTDAKFLSKKEMGDCDSVQVIIGTRIELEAIKKGATSP